MKKVFIFLFAFSLIFCISPLVNAEDNYKSQYEASGADGLKYALDDDTRAFLEQNGIDASDCNFINNVSVSGVFSHIAEFLKSGMKRPFKSGALLTAIILITAAISAFGTETEKFAPALYAAALAVTAIISKDILECISASVNSAKGVTTFMLAFIPVFIGIMAISGKAVTAAASGAVLITASDFFAYCLSFLVLPTLGCYLSVTVSSSVSPLLEKSGTAELLKKLSVWAMSLISTVFIGILGLQTAVNSAADTLTMKTAKFIVGTSVPIAGAALSEAAGTVYSSMNLLKSTVGIYGIVAIIIILLPIIIELILWRLILLVNASAGDMFGLSKISGLLRAVDTMLSTLIGILLFIGTLFIISLGVLITAGKT